MDAAPGLFRVGITPYYFSLIDRGHPHCPVRMQVIPRARELTIEEGDLVDPLGEDAHSPATGIFHRYPDRCLLLAVDRCAIYCRHCNRRRLVGQEESPISRQDLDQAIGYIRRTPAIRDVLISGGDPLTLSTDRLEDIVARVRAIPHVEIIRIGTRVPVVLPMRIDDELCAMLRRYHPLYINTHFNHPKELTPLARAACERLADAGIPLGNQTVLLRGVNSSTRVMRKLFTELLKVRVRPYYLFQGDVAAGTSHLRTSVETGIEIMQNLRGWISGLAIPHLVIDTPGGMGKVSIGPDYVVARGADKWTLRNYEGRLVDYPPNRGTPTPPAPTTRCTGDRRYAILVVRPAPRPFKTAAHGGRGKLFVRRDQSYEGALRIWRPSERAGHPPSRDQILPAWPGGVR